MSCFTSVLRQCKNHGQKFWMETSIFQQFPIAKSVYKRIPKISQSDIFEHHFFYKILENFVLLKFNREKLQLEFNEGSYKCCQCGLRKLGEECVYEDACPHVVCKSCLQRHYHQKLKNRETLSWNVFLTTLMVNLQIRAYSKICHKWCWCLVFYEILWISNFKKLHSQKKLRFRNVLIKAVKKI